MQEKLKGMIIDSDEGMEIKDEHLEEFLDLVESEEYFTYVTDKKQEKKSKLPKEDLLQGINENQIKIGKVFKNYKDMCEKLNIAQYGTSKRYRQLKEIEAYYFEYDKQCHKMTVTKIHNLNELQRRARTLRSDYRDYIEEILLSQMVDFIKKEERKILKNKKEDDEESSPYSIKMVTSPNQLARALSMVNKHYTTSIYNAGAYCSITNTSQDVFNDWKQSVSSFIRNSIKNAISNLEDKSLIFSSKRMMVGSYDFSDFGIKQDSYGGSYLGFDTSTRDIDIRPATDDEIGVILSSQGKALCEMGVDRISDVYKQFGKSGSTKFTSRVIEILNKEKGYDIAFYFMAYELIFTEDVISKYTEAQSIDFGLTNRAKQEYNRQLNNMIMERISENVEKRHKRAVDDFNNGENMTSTKLCRTNERYIEDSEKANKLLINVNSRTMLSRQINSLKKNDRVKIEDRNLSGKRIL